MRHRDRYLQYNIKSVFVILQQLRYMKGVCSRVCYLLGVAKIEFLQLLVVLAHVATLCIWGRKPLLNLGTKLSANWKCENENQIKPQ